MARVASAVHLVTTDGPGGRAGFTASAVCSVSDAPPTLLVCVNRTTSAYAALRENDALCVSTLAAEQAAIAAAFGGRTPMAARFAAAAWTTLVTGAPALRDALTAFDCRIVARHPVGTHDVLYCEVVGLAEPGAGHALVYADRGYHTVTLGGPARREDAA
ncbi:flavin reductase [Methylobacterium sp. J-068]|uniref:flavin reductase n=1 Tax=Methylobacterium sp. J-068 TaxID=2836649 RepID=UPI001FB8698E|nr:flavin reductase [Methylobacterium sp. J-068]MCJ2033205.1 flavin reductase [Methylobacterium sp. J-068]